MSHSTPWRNCGPSCFLWSHTQWICRYWTGWYRPRCRFWVACYCLTSSLGYRKSKSLAHTSRGPKYDWGPWVSSRTWPGCPRWTASREWSDSQKSTSACGSTWQASYYPPSPEAIGQTCRQRRFLSPEFPLSCTAPGPAWYSRPRQSPCWACISRYPLNHRCTEIRWPGLPQSQNLTRLGEAWISQFVIWGPSVPKCHKLLCYISRMSSSWPPLHRNSAMPSS